MTQGVTGTKGTDEYDVYVGLPEDVDGMGVSDLLGKYTSDKVIIILNWVVRVNDDLVLDPGEKVVMFIYYYDTSVRMATTSLKLRLGFL